MAYFPESRRVWGELSSTWEEVKKTAVLICVVMHMWCCVMQWLNIDCYSSQRQGMNEEQMKFNDQLLWLASRKTIGCASHA